MALDGLRLDDLNVNDCQTFFLCPEYDTGSGSIEQVALSSLLVDGDVLAGVRTGNRTFKIPLRVQARSRIALAEALGQVSRVVDRERFTLRHDPAGGLPVLFDCYRGSVVKTSSFRTEKFAYAAALELTFQAQPFARNPALSTAAVTTSNLSALLPRVKGSARTRARVELDLPGVGNPGGTGWSVLVAAFSGMRAGYDPYVFYGGESGTFDVTIDLPSANFRPGTYQVWARCSGEPTSRVRSRTQVSRPGVGSFPFESEPVVSAPLGDGLPTNDGGLRTRFVGELELPALPIAAGATSPTFRIVVDTEVGTSSVRFFQLYLIPSDASVAFTQGWSQYPTTMVLDSLDDGRLMVSAGSSAAEAVSIMDLTLAAGVITLEPGSNRLFVSAGVQTMTGQLPGIPARVSYFERFHFDRDTLDAAGFGGGFSGGFT